MHSLTNELVRGPLHEGFESTPPLFGPDDRIDEVLPLEKLFHVVDADASQAPVIEEVSSGHNLVVRGPQYEALISVSERPRQSQTTPDPGHANNVSTAGRVSTRGASSRSRGHA